MRAFSLDNNYAMTTQHLHQHLHQPEDKLKDFRAFLQGHSVFNAIGDLPAAPNAPYLRNLLAHNVSSDELLVYDPRGLRLFVVALNSWSTVRVEQIQVLVALCILLLSPILT